MPRETTLDGIKKAAFLLFPSACYEGMPLTIVEAFACGVPVIASRLGTAAEMVSQGRTGLLFDAGDPADLARQVEWARCHQGEMIVMGRSAREEFEQKYTAHRNLDLMLRIYDDAIAASWGRRTSSAQASWRKATGGADSIGPVPR